MSSTWISSGWNIAYRDLHPKLGVATQLCLEPPSDSTCFATPTWRRFWNPLGGTTTIIAAANLIAERDLSPGSRGVITRRLSAKRVARDVFNPLRTSGPRHLATLPVLSGQV